MIQKNIHLPIFFFAFLSLITSIFSGWQRIGWNIDLSNVVSQHGTLMASVFFGTLLMLEKCLAMPSRYYLLIPFVNGISILFLYFGNVHLALSLTTLASAAMCGVAFEMKRIAKQKLYWLFIVGFFCLFAGNIFLLFTGLFQASAVLWMSFILFIIVGERLELTRFLAVTVAQKNLLWIALSLVLIGVGPYHFYGNYIFGIGIICVSLWLLKFDIAFKNLKQKGQPHYSALTIIIGYFWLIVSAFYIITADTYNHFDYDALLHSFFLGFAFSMIFAHVPIIFPSLFKLKIKIYHPVYYVIITLMNLSVAARIIGDQLQSDELRKWAGLTNGLVILLFFMSTIIIVFNGLRKSVN